MLYYILYNFIPEIAPTTMICASTGLLGCSHHGIWMPLHCSLFGFLCATPHAVVASCLNITILWFFAPTREHECWSGVLNNMNLALLYFHFSCLAKRMCYLKQKIHLKVNVQVQFYLVLTIEAICCWWLPSWHALSENKHTTPLQYTQAFFPNRFIH